MRRSPRPRKVASLSVSVHRQLNMYALAAGAAGVASLALAQPAEAKIVYTPAHVVILANQQYGLDLAHDGQVDFTLSNTTWHTTYDGRGGSGLALNREGQVNCSFGSSRRGSFAAALLKGVRLSSKNFVCGGGNMVVWSTSGPWQNVRGRYLGLRFQINDKTHYGWARLNVSTVKGIVATLTGYAYETIPNKPIITGKTHGRDVIVKHATLSQLALGRK